MSENKTIKTTVVADTSAYRKGMQDASRETRDFTRQVESAGNPLKDVDAAMSGAGRTVQDLGGKWRRVAGDLGNFQEQMRNAAAAMREMDAARLATEIEALSSAVLLVGGMMGTAALAAAGLGVAMAAGARESAAMQLALDATSNYAGQTVGSMQALATQMAESGKVSVGTAKSITMELAASGKIGQGAFDSIAESAADFARVTGTEVAKVAPELVKLFEDPAKGAENLNEKMHFLTVAEIEQIKTLQEMGKQTEAQTVLAERLNAKLATIPENLGILERAWRAAGNAASSAWDKMKGVGREKTNLENINEIAQDLERGTTDAYGGDSGARAALSRLLAQQVAEYQRTKSAAAAAEQNARDQQAQALIRENSKGYKADEIRSKIAMVKAQSEDGLTDEQIKQKSEALKELNKQLDDLLKPEKEKKGPKPRIDDDRVVSDWQKRVDLLGAEASGQEKLTAVEQAYVSVLSEVSSGRLKMTNAGKARLATLAAEAMALEQTQLQEKEAAKAAEEHAKWVDALYQAQEKETTRLEEALKKEDERVSALGMSKEAVNQLAAAQLEEAAAAKEVYAANLRASSAFAGEFADAYQRAADEAQKQADILRQTAGKKMEAATKEAQIETQKGWEKVGEDVARSLTDAIVAGGSDGKKLLERAFKATVFRVAVQPVIQGAVGALAGNAAASAGGSGSLGSGLLTNTALGPLGGMAGVISGLSSLAAGTSLGAFGAGMASGVASFGSIGSSMATLSAGSAAGGAVGAGMMIGTVAPYLAAGLALAQALGTFSGPTYHHGGAYQSDTQGNTTKLTSSSLGLAGFDLGWGAYGSDRSASFDEAMKAMSYGLATQIAESVKKYGGDPSSMKVSSRFASDNSDYSVGALRITDATDRTLFDLDKRYSADAAKAMQDFGNDSVRALVGALKASDLSDEFDQLFASVDPLTSSIENLNTVLEQAAAIQQQISAINDAVDSYFLEPAAQLDKAFGKLGTSVPVTKDAFEQLVQAQDLNTAAGRDMATSLMSVYPLWQQVQDAATQAAQATAQAAQDAADAAADLAAQVASQRYDLETQLLELQGNTAALRERELATIDASNRALKEQIYALQDAKTAEEARTSSLQSAAAAADQAVTTAENALRAAYQKEAATLQQTATQFSGFASSLKKIREQLLIGDASPLSLSARSSEMDKQWALVSARARLGDASAIESLQGMYSDYLTVAKDSSASAEDYYAKFAMVQAVLQDTESVSTRTADVAQQQLDTLTSQVSALVTLNDSVLSVRDAISALAAAKAAASAVPPTSISAGAAAGYVNSPLNENGSRTGIGDSGYQIVESAGKATLYFPGGASHAVSGPDAKQMLVDAYGLRSGGLNGTLIRTRAVGGYTPPGLTLVGEEGPELVNFGQPSMIYTAAQSKAMMSVGNDALIAEVQALRAELAALRAVSEAAARHAYSTARTLDRVTRGGESMLTEAAA